MVENPPAFPCSELRNTSSDPFATPKVINHPGMTLRDWFAGQALSGILAAGAGEEDCDILRGIIAEDAYGYADAMLAARTPSPEGPPHEHQ